MRRYQGDPKWITARFDSECRRCKAPIKRNDRAFYYPNGHAIYCADEACGGQEHRDFCAAAFDEDFATG